MAMIDRGILYMLHIASKGVTFTQDNKTISDGSVDFILDNFSTLSVTTEGSTLALSLYKVEFNRKMFQPGHIKAEVLVQTTVDRSKSLSIDLLKKLFLRRPVKLSVVNKTDYIAENYYIHSISPEMSYTVSNGKKEYNIYTKLDIFSLDNLLALDKFSQAYLGKKLIGGIVDDALSSYQISYTYSGGVSASVTVTRSSVHALQQLSYSTSSGAEEMVQPYLVQYNESLYDFIARVANRCGEAMYFEGGTLCFGLPNNVANVEISSGTIIYNPISGGVITVEPYARDSAKKDSENTTDFSPKDFNSEQIDRENDGFPSDAFYKPSSSTVKSKAYQSELPAEDHYILLYKDKFAAPLSKGGGSIWWDNPDTKGMELVSHVLNSTSLLEMILDYGIQTMKSAASYDLRKSIATEAGNKLVNDNMNTTGTGPAILYSKVDTSPSHWITRKYYANVKSKQEAQMREMVCVDLKDAYQSVQLGGTITLPGDDKVYVVVRVDMVSKEVSVLEDDQEDQAEQAEQVEEPELQVISPGYQRIYAIPKDGTAFYPPLIPGDLFRKSGPQPAFVTYSSDPKGQGRVRVRFAWQDRVEGTDKDKYNADSSPWIRMVTPMATAGGGGMYFQPEVGDEVMLNFENGNIDHPYVAGMLFSKNTVTPNVSNRNITSRNGHSIKFLDPDDSSAFLAGLYPGVKFLKSFGVPIQYDWGEDFNKAVGGIELSDKLGFYRIAMSSHSRNITVSSPFGDVKIDAFTGITIKAPNGNVRIEGKNVDIIANNNLTLSSGKNIKESLLLQKETRMEAIGRILGKKSAELLYSSFIDFSLLRTILEVVIRPVDGTLLIKSHRYLLLEAGDGKATISADKYNQGRFQSAEARKLYKAQNEKDYHDAPASHAVAEIETFLPELKQALRDFVVYFLRSFNAVQAEYAVLKAEDMYFVNGASKQYIVKSKVSGDTQFNDPFSLLKDIFVQMDTCGDAVNNNPYEGKIDKHDAAPAEIDVTAVEAKILSLSKKVWDLKGVKHYAKCLDLVLNNHTTLPNTVKNDLVKLDLLPINQSVFYYWVKGVADYFSGSSPSEAVFDNQLRHGRFIQWEQTVLRRAALSAIQTYKDPDASRDFSIPDPTYVSIADPARFGRQLNSTPTDASNPVSNSDWALYTHAIALKESAPAGGNGKGLADGMMEGFADPAEKLSKWNEWMVWQDTAKGEIVFSNKSNRSYRFSGNGPTEVYVSTHAGELDALSDRLREALRKL